MPQGRIGWMPWSRDAFDRAGHDRRLVLLLITTQWSTGCAEMLSAAYADPVVIAAVEERFVPVLVDAEARPDIAERYSLDGWPSTLLLTPDGEILSGVTYAEAPLLAALLDRTALLYAADPGAIAARAHGARAERQRERRPGAADAEVASSLPSDIAAALLASADEAEGGFVESPKCFHGDALLFLLRYGFLSRDERAVGLVRRTMSAIAGSGMFDADAGISRCAHGPGWDRPVSEHDAATQSAALRVYAEGCAIFDDERWRADARRLAKCVVARWLSPSARTAAYTDQTADLSAATLLCAAALEEHELARRAVSALEEGAFGSYRPGQGVAHSATGGTPRLLTDHVAVIRALLNIHELTGELPYSMLAEELGWFVLKRFADADAGAFRDRVHADDPADDLGRLAEPCHPFRANALAAHALACLSGVSGEPEFAAAAAVTLAWAAGRWRAHGLEAASCGIAALDLIDWRFPSPSGGGHHTIR
jgi:uncharacterized protein YyaL (SSP411 family)